MADITLHAGQSEVFENQFVELSNKYSVVCCARGWGKSYKAAVSASAAIWELMAMPRWVEHKTVYIIAPTYDQVTDIYFPLLAWELGLEDYAIKSSRAEGRFIFEGGIELRLLSYESVERMRGKGAYYVVWDEVSSCIKGIKPKEAWESVIQPCLVTRWSPMKAEFVAKKWHKELKLKAQERGEPEPERPVVSPGRGLFISTPKGYNYFYELYHKEEKNKDWKSYHFDYHSSPYLDPSEIAKVKLDLDPLKFASEYMASFEDSGNNVFYTFERKKHVDKELEDFRPPEDGEDGEDVHVAIDFNVGLMAASCFAVRDNVLHFLHEFKGHPDTETLAISLKTRFKGHKIRAYPDPAGRARKTSAPVGVTDFSILQSHGIKCLARPKAPPIADSVQAVNRKLMNAHGTMGMRVHPRCEGLVTSLERTKWVDSNPDTATIDKSESIEHYSDGVRYAVEYLYPVRNGTKKSVRGFGF